MVSLKTLEPENLDKVNKNLPKLGIDIICIIDTSGSMLGEKIDLVKTTLK